MPLDILSSIKGAKSSKAIEKLFQDIKNNHFDLDPNSLNFDSKTYDLESLRDDEIIESSELEKLLIKKNFPKSKNDYLVVNKVID